MWDATVVHALLQHNTHSSDLLLNSFCFSWSVYSLLFCKLFLIAFAQFIYWPQFKTIPRCQGEKKTPSLLQQILVVTKNRWQTMTNTETFRTDLEQWTIVISLKWPLIKYFCFFLAAAFLSSLLFCFFSNFFYRCSLEKCINVIIPFLSCSKERQVHVLVVMFQTAVSLFF